MAISSLKYPMKHFLMKQPACFTTAEELRVLCLHIVT